MADHLEFDCYYQGGRVLTNQTVCPLEYNGEPLQYTESRLVTDAETPQYTGFLLLILLFWLASQKQK